MRSCVLLIAAALTLPAQTRETNPVKSPQEIAEGKRLYVLNCRSCHGDNGERIMNGIRLASRSRRHGTTDREMYHTMANGIAGTMMPGSFLEEDKLWKILAFVRTLEPTAADHAEVPSIRTKPMGAVRQVSNAELLKPPSGEWLHYSGDYHGTHFSTLDQINSSNVGRMKIEWMFQRPMREKFQTTPIIAGGVMYITVPPNEVYALDAATGEAFWEYKRTLPVKMPLCCGQVNRGVAISGDRVFLATLDAHLVALDRKTGKVVWDRKLAEPAEGYSATHAPLVVKDKVLVGVAGGEYGVRGFLDAYRIRDGERIWRSYTIPGPGEFGNDTWGGDSWKTGAAAIWVTGTYDPESNLTYWGTSNPGPDWNGDVRPGDNLFSCSVLALDADTGQRKWHFQFTPHDTHDWDAVQVQVLADRKYKGRDRKLMITANRNGFYYVLDRLTGEFLHGREFVKQTWAKGLDAKGRPILVPGQDPTETGHRVWPSAGGGTNWWSPSYSPITGLFYVGVMERSALYLKNEAVFRPGMLFEGGTAKGDDDTSWSAIRALDALTGEKVWDYKIDLLTRAGVTSTAGNLVLGGTGDGRLVALDAKTGKLLWQQSLGGLIMAAPVPYLVNGKQRFAVAAGSAMVTFGLPD